ncbi:MAG TPA: hypothetical protein V6D07_19025 [Trichocoleus sp.]
MAAGTGKSTLQSGPTSLHRVIAALREDRTSNWEEQKHPRDRRGRFSKKRQGGFGKLSSGEAGGTGGSGASEKKPEDDGLDNMTIRQLKRVAQEEKIVGYSEMGKDALKKAIRVARENPDTQENIRKSLEFRKTAREVINKTPPGKLARKWERLQKLIKFAGVSPIVGAAVMVAWGTNQAVDELKRQKKIYSEGLNDQAKNASARASKVSAQSTEKDFITFTVGGFSGTGSTAEKLAEALKKDYGDDEDGWIDKSQHIIPVSPRTNDIKIDSPKTIAGIANPAYLGEYAVKYVGRMMQNFQRKESDAATELAAQIYAHAIKRVPNPNGGRSTRINAEKVINIVAHGAGGQVVDEALEILKRMKLKDAEEGSSVLKRVNVVKLGSPAVGWVDPPEDVRDRSQNIYGTDDPFSGLPKQNPQWVSGVKGGDIDDYFASEDARKAVRDGLGYGTGSYFEVETVKGRKEEVQRNREKLRNLGKKIKTPDDPEEQGFPDIPDPWGDDDKGSSSSGGAPKKPNPKPPTPSQPSTAKTQTSKQQSSSKGADNPPEAPPPATPNKPKPSGGSSGTSSSKAKTEAKPPKPQEPKSSESSDRTKKAKKNEPKPDPEPEVMNTSSLNEVVEKKASSKKKQAATEPVKTKYEWVSDPDHPEGGYLRENKNYKAKTSEQTEAEKKAEAQAEAAKPKTTRDYAKSTPESRRAAAAKKAEADRAAQSKTATDPDDLKTVRMPESPAAKRWREKNGKQVAPENPSGSDKPEGNEAKKKSGKPKAEAKPAAAPEPEQEKKPASKIRSVKTKSGDERKLKTQNPVRAVPEGYHWVQDPNHPEGGYLKKNAKGTGRKNKKQDSSPHLYTLTRLSVLRQLGLGGLNGQ